MLLPDDLTHSKRDVRLTEAGTISYHLEWQEGIGGYPITVSWAAALPLGAFTIRDDMTGTIIPPVDMASVQQLVVPDSLSFVTGLIIEVAPEIDLIPPLGPFNFRVLTLTPGDVTLTWDVAVEDHFAYYEILYDTTAFVDDAAYVWDWTEDQVLSNISTTQTTIPFPWGVVPSFFRIRAWDTFGNAGALSDLVSVTNVAGDPDVTLPAGPRIVGVYPNPFSSATTIACRLPEAARGELSVYDLRGRLVTRLDLGDETGESRIVEWSGLDDRGRRVASGAYFCVLRSPSGVDRERIILLR